jgi:FMN phosphatase YigB (HAD superfamily)
MNKTVKYLLLDAANTLIYKPELWNKFIQVFEKHNYNLQEIELKQKHKLLSEVIHFPDVTSKDFYYEFNSELCRLLGIVPCVELLHDIFDNCKYLPWEAFEDTISLRNIDVPMGVLSNFNSGLSGLLSSKLQCITFKNVIISETEGISKPNIDFYKRAIDIIGVNPNEIMYVGDSIKLDIEPALNLGFQVRLIDRDDFYKSSSMQLNSLNSLINYE